MQYDAKLQRVEYRLSEKGQSLMPILTQLQNWGMMHIPGVLSIGQMQEAAM